MEDWDTTFKIIIIGDAGVGKSSLLYRFSDNAYDFNYKATIGVDFKIRSIKLDDKISKLQLWDTAGQDRFISITTSYYRGAHGVLLVYDVTSEDSFNNIPKWMAEIEKYARANVNIMLVGNKSDLKSKRVIEYQRGLELAESLGLSFMETSAKDSTNVEEAFRLLAIEIRNQITPQQINRSNRSSKIKLETRKIKEKPQQTDKEKCACGV